MTDRVSNWPAALSAKVEEWRLRPFAYGSADCLQFAGDVVLALTGVDYRDQFPAYGSQEQAEAIMAGGGVAGLLSGLFGLPKAAAQAMRGDIVLIDFGDGLAAGVCLGVVCCAPGPAGLVFRPTAQAVAAWSI